MRPCSAGGPSGGAVYILVTMSESIAYTPIALDEQDRTAQQQSHPVDESPDGGQ